MSGRAPLQYPVVIMVSGYLKSGKDTVGDHLVDTYGFRKLAFATAMKDEVANVYSLDRNSLNTQEGKDLVLAQPASPGLPPTVRGLLIQHAERARERDPQYWAKRLVSSGSLNHPAIVITDFRFPAEFDFIRQVAREAGARVHTWRIHRWAKPPLVNPTETALDLFDFDHVIDNNGAVGDLLDRIDALLEHSI